VARRGTSHLDLPKTLTGIAGLDEITGGGLPRGRTTVVRGAAGSGKTLLATEFLVRGATQYREPGVFVSFEEPINELALNARSLGFDLPALVRRRLLLLDHIQLERNEPLETGAYDLSALFIRLGAAIDRIGAKRVVLDTIEMLFAGLADTVMLRAELGRLFRWLKTKGVTAIVTGERAGGGSGDHPARNALEEFVSDCVILLDQRVDEQNATRRLRILKYRGSAHGASEYPFLIDDRGISVLPISSLGLVYPASTRRLSTGVAGLDEMLGRRGVFAGSSILASGTAGTGKSSLAAHFADAACRRGERVLYFAFEESANQIARNVRSLGVNLAPWLRRGRLHIHAQRPTAHGLESHLASMQRHVATWKPAVVIVDPVTNLGTVGSNIEVKAMLARLIDYMKSRQITALFTSLSDAGDAAERTDVAVSSLMDVWILLSNQEANGERTRKIQIVKARGMSHSNQVREFVMGRGGFTMVDVRRTAAGRIMTGSTRDVAPSGNGRT
jgi:circadian clock protein KaiC